MYKTKNFNKCVKNMGIITTIERKTKPNSNAKFG